MTTTDSLLELFPVEPRKGKDLTWYADVLVNIAQHTDHVLIGNRRRVDDPAVCELIGQVDSPTADVIYLPQNYQRLLRPLLARMATLGADETGAPWNPYGGSFTLARSSRSGPVRLHVEFENTPAAQWIRFTRTELGRTHPAANGSPAAARTEPVA